MSEQGNGGSGGEVLRLLGAAMIGVIVGASLGLLLAPKPGSELRTELRERAGSAADKAQVVHEKARQLVETAKQKLEERRAGEPADELAEEPAEQPAEEA